jgi:biotin operon repressor
VRVGTAMLFKFHNTRKDRCFPSHEAMAGWVGLDRRNVIKAIKQLERYGYLIVERGTGRSNAYRFIWAREAALDEESGDAADTSGVTLAPPGGDAPATSEVTLPTP